MRRQLKLAAAAAKADAVIATKNKVRSAKAKLNQPKGSNKLHHAESSFSSQSSGIEDSPFKAIRVVLPVEVAPTDQNLQSEIPDVCSNQELKNSRDFPLFAKKMAPPITLTGYSRNDALVQDAVQVIVGGIGDATTGASSTELVPSLEAISSSFSGMSPSGRHPSLVQVQDPASGLLTPILLNAATMAMAIATPLPQSPLSLLHTSSNALQIQPNGTTVAQALGQPDKQGQQPSVQQLMLSALPGSQALPESNSIILDVGPDLDKSGYQQGTKEPVFVFQDEKAVSCQMDIKTMLNMILEEIRDMRKTQQIEILSIQQRLGKIEEAVASLPGRLHDAELRISTLEDQMIGVLQQADLVSREKLTMENKIEELENFSRRSNLRIVGVPERLEGGDTLKWVETFIKKTVLPDFAGDLTLTRAHRVPAHLPPNEKFPRTILINFADYRVKEKVLTRAIQLRQFVIENGVKCRIFSDMSAAAARRRKEFLKLLYLFKTQGAQASIAQQSKLKVLVHGKFHLFTRLEEAQELLKKISV